jgi:uncharacterized protein YbjT (DUF2867 family)
MYVILGVSGNTGSVAARALLEQKKPVRAVVRNASKGETWKKLGAEVVVADVENSKALEQAFTGATGVYALLPPDLKTTDLVARNKRIGDTITAALKTAKVPHVVLLSSVGAQHASGTGPVKTIHYVETKIREAGINATFVRAAYFMENNLSMLELMKSQGILPVFADATYPFPQVATKDIGQIVAQSLIEGAKGVQVIELAGPKDASMNDVAAAFSQALGRPVKTAQQPLDALVPAMIQMGLSKNMAEEYREMYEGMGQGKLSFEGGNARSIRGRIDITTFANNVLRN